jgi:cation:H+ antiporter
MPLSDAAAYPIWGNAILFLAAGLVIWFAGGRLTLHLDAVAAKTRLDRAFVGMLLLGGITSLPEVANTITAASIGNPALAVNNLLGSAAINVLLLAVVDAFIGHSAVTAIVAKPSTMMMAATCMIVLVLIAALITVGDIALAGIGVGSVAIAGASILSFWMSATHDRRSPWSVDDDDDGVSDIEEKDPQPDASLAKLWCRVAIHGALIFAAGYTLSQVGDGLAKQLGFTSAIVGFGLIGPATSLPELVTIIAALRIGRPEMAFGQVLGTNFVNLSLIPLGDAVYRGAPIITKLGKFEVISSLLGAMLIGIFMVGLLEHRDRTIFRMGIDSALVIVVFTVGTVVLACI